MLPAVPWAEVRSYPAPGDSDHARLLDGFQRHLLEHPCVRHHLQTGSLEPVMISDFVSSAGFHRLGLYDAVYRRLNVEDQIGFCIGEDGGATVAIAVSRDRRTFGERERTLLSTPRPHIARAWKYARVMNREPRPPDGVSTEAAAQCAVFLDERNRPRELPAIAARWLGNHFGAWRALARDELPVDVVRWLQARKPAATRPLVHHYDGNRLVIRRLLDLDSSRIKNVLLLERRTRADGTDHLKARGLTQREIEVLGNLEQGSTNEEIAGRLHTSPLTVKNTSSASTASSASATAPKPRDGA